MAIDRSAAAEYGLSSRSFWFLTLLAFAVTRVGILPTVLDFRADELLYQEWAVLIGNGSFPVGDDLYQYPPAAGLLFLGLEVAPGDFHRTFTAAAIGADVLIFLLLSIRVARNADSWRGPWVWIIGGLLAGGLLYERFDVFSAFLAVIALTMLPRPLVLGFVVGIGAAVKVWPIFILFALRRDQVIRGVLGATAGVLASLVLGFAVASNSLSFLTGQTQRGLQIEATPAAPILIAAQLGLMDAPSVDRFGSTELDAAFGGLVAWIGITLAVAMIATVVVQRLRGKLDSIPGPDVALAVLLVFVAFNRVNSSQFFIWIAAVASVVLLNRQSRMAIPVLLSLLSMLPVFQYLGPFYWALQAQTPEAVFLQVVRALLVLASALLAWWFVISGRPYCDDSEAKERI